MGNLVNKTVSSVKWTATEKFSTQVINFIVSLVIARILSPSDYGVIGMLTIFLSVADAFIDCGFSNALIQKIDRTETDFSTVFHFNMGVSIFCYAILFFSAPWIADFFNTPILTDVTRVVSLNLVVSAFSSVQTAQLTIRLDFRKLARVGVISSLSSGIIGIITAYMGWGVWALVISTLGSRFIRSIMLWSSTHWHPRLIFSVASFKQLFSFGGNYLLANLLSQVYFNMSGVIIGKSYTPKDLGYYSRGESFSKLLSSNLTSILQKVTFPILSEIQNDSERLIGAYRKYIKVTSLVIFFLMTLLAVLAKPLILLLLTEKWYDAILYLQIFCFVMMFDHLCSINLNLLQVKGRTDLLLKLEIIKRIISFAILFASIPFGILAICLSKVIYSQFAVFINTYYTGKLFGLGYIEQFKDYSKYLLFSIIACVPAYLLTFTKFPHIVVLIIGATFSAVIYFFLLKVMADKSFLALYSICAPKLIKFVNKMQRLRGR